MDSLGTILSFFEKVPFGTYQSPDGTHVLSIQILFFFVQSQKHFPHNIFLVSKFCLKYTVLFTFT